MPLQPGTRLGPYEIGSSIGAGGMGEVYRAVDARLGRSVAIKVLPAAFASDPERLARFEREARTLAALNHPNIAQVFGLEDGPSGRAIAMELVEGPTLAERNDRGPVPEREVLEIARQIADALSVAHDHGIVHRDVKPTNIKLTATGQVKVLDFGLAKPVSPSRGDSIADASTLTSPALVTGAGIVLGTAAYMSPEQARGEAVDKRADVWAFGCVLYEMLTGRRAFAGNSVADTVAAIISSQPDLGAVAPRYRPLLGLCLEKDPRKRLRDLGDAFHLLERSPAGVDAPRRMARGSLVASVALLAVASAAAGALVFRTPPAVSAEQPLLSIDIDLGLSSASGAGVGPMALSPDGEHVVVVSGDVTQTRRLVRRSLASSVATPLVGTEGASFPFFSPDGDWVGFFAGGKLKKVAFAGGPVTVLCDATAGRGGTWNRDGVIVAALDTRTGLSAIPAAGGVPTPLTTLDRSRRDASHRFPRFMPDGDSVIFTIAVGDPAFYASADIAVASLKTRTVKRVAEGAGTYPRYLGNGHLMYANGGNLYAVPFDPGRLEVTGPPAVVIEGLAMSSSSGSAMIDVLPSGRAVYQRGGVASQTLQWLDDGGKTEPTAVPPGEVVNVRVSPDGGAVAFSTGDAIWAADLRTGRRTRLTANGTRANNVPIWTPDGRFIVYRGDGELFAVPADGGRPPERLAGGDALLSPLDISPDGKNLVYYLNGGGSTVSEMFLAPLEMTGAGLRLGRASKFMDVVGAATLAGFSPDGRWFAYASAKSGVYEVYVRAFPDSGSEWLVSSGGGHLPTWSKAGGELFYRTDDGRVLVVDYVASGDRFRAGEPRQWSPRRLQASGLTRNFDVSRDGMRILTPVAGDTGELPTHARLLINFFDEVRRKTRANPPTN